MENPPTTGATTPPAREQEEGRRWTALVRLIRRCPFSHLHDFLSCFISLGHVYVIFGLVTSCLVMFGYVWSCLVMFGHFRLCLCLIMVL